MRFEDQSFQQQKVSLDGNEFLRCKFVSCHIEYSGILPFHLDSNNFEACSWGFGGPAANAIAFMSALYSQGGESKALIEQTFENIRRGNVTSPTH